MANQVNVKHALYFFNEYLYHTMIEDLNTTLVSYDKIRTTRARELRLEMGKAAAKAYTARTGKRINARSVFSAATTADFAAAAQEVFKNVPGADAFMERTFGRDGGIEYIRARTAEFRGMTGIDGKSQVAKPDRAMLPLSPYDPQFSGRQSFINNGSKLLYADADDLLRRTQNVAVYPDRPIDPQTNPVGFLSFDNVGMCMDETMPVYTMTDWGKLREAGMGLSSDDLSGVSALRPFMSDEEYRDITRNYGGLPWSGAAVTPELDGNGDPVMANGQPVMRHKYMSPQAIARVREVVRVLRSEGEDFKFAPDRRPGQVKLKFNNGMEVRVLDPYSEDYAGARVYKNGTSMYYQMPSWAASVRGQAYVPYVPQTAEECLDLIHFAEGKPVSCWGGGKAIGEPEVFEYKTSGKSGSKKNRCFHRNSNMRVQAGVKEMNVDGTVRKVPVSIFARNNKKLAAMSFEDEAEADKYLQDSVKSARDSLMAVLDIDGLIRERDAHADELDFYMPPLSTSEDVAAIQRDYWDVLVGARDTLLRPDVERDDYTEAVETLSEDAVRAMTYQGTPEEIIRAHAEDIIQNKIGSFESDETGKRFNPVLVARYMSGGLGEFRNTENLVAAMRKVRMSESDIKGDEFYNSVVADRLIQFDPEGALVMKDHPSPFVRNMGQVIADSLRANACYVDEEKIRIDANGIVRYEAERISSEAVPAAGSGKSDRRPVTGEIGRVLVPDAKGVVHANGYYFVPGYEAYIEPNKPGEYKPYEQRMVLEGYEAVLTRTIRENLREDLMSYQSEIGTPTSLDNAVRHLYETRYPEDFYERTEEDGMSPELRDAIIATNAARVHFKGNILDEAGRVALFMAHNKSGRDPLDDYYTDAATLTDGRNVAIMEEPGDGLFDRYFTGNGTSQGIRYLVAGATVDESGHVVPSDDKDARCAMVNYLRDSGRMPDFDAADRMNMTGNGLLHCLRETAPSGVAQMSFGGMNFEDGIIVSKKFAEANQVRDVNGVFRPLMPGDKMECHGNKGVIAFVIDPDMPEAEAREQKLWKQVQTFRDNPSLDVVMAPYSPVSRFNAGLAREALASAKQDLTLPDGRAVPGGIGHVKFTILEQTADTKTHFSDDATQKRSYGAQMGWAIAAQDCPDVMRMAFRDNYKSAANLREMLITMGMDMDPTGRLQIGYHAHPGETRNIIEMTDLKKDLRLTVKGRKELASVPESERDAKEQELLQDPEFAYSRIDREFMRQEFGETISVMGGFVELPFPIKYPGENMGTIPEIRQDDRTQAARDAYSGRVWAMPIMSSFLRSGQEFESGNSVVHDYTASYLRIFDASLTYRAEMEKGEAADPAVLAKCIASAQSDYEKITDDLTHRKFEGKHNIFRTGLMANKQPRSGTAIWSPDPRLSVTEIGMNPEMAATLGIKDGDYALMHRDPVLQGSGLRAMRVLFDSSLAGISVNPMGVPGGMDGDFDGDTAGIRAVNGKVEVQFYKDEKTGQVACRKIDLEKTKGVDITNLIVENNLLDKSTVNEQTGEYELFIASGQDIAAAWAVNPELKAKYEDLRTKVNIVERHAGTWDAAKLADQRRKATEQIDSYLQDCCDQSFGVHVLSYSDPAAYMQSVQQFVDDGAKGSSSKVDTFARFAGITYERDKDGKIISETVEMRPDTMASRDENVGVLMSKNAQQQYTGFGGSFSIRAMTALMNVDPDAATRANKLATQAVLQVKHNPEQADRLELVLTGPARDVWHGYKLEPCTVTLQHSTVVPDGKGGWMPQIEETEVDSWQVVKDDQGKPVVATTAEFKQQFMDVYGSKRGMGLSVPPDLVNRIARALDDGRGYMLDLEDGAVAKYGAPLQKLAYGGTIEDVRQMARDMTDNPSAPGLFEAPSTVRFNYNACMADASVIGPNLRIKAENQTLPDGQKKEYRPLFKSDVALEGDVRELKEKGIFGTVSTAVNLGSYGEQADALYKQLIDESASMDLEDTDDFE